MQLQSHLIVHQAHKFRLCCARSIKYSHTLWWSFKFFRLHKNLRNVNCANDQHVDEAFFFSKNFTKSLEKICFGPKLVFGFVSAWSTLWCGRVAIRVKLSLSFECLREIIKFKLCQQHWSDAVQYENLQSNRVTMSLEWISTQRQELSEY